MNKKQIIIERLALSANTGFDIDMKIAKQTATKYVNDGNINLDNPLINHGSLDDYAIDMLDKYHILSQSELKQKLIEFANSK